MKYLNQFMLYYRQHINRPGVAQQLGLVLTYFMIPFLLTGPNITDHFLNQNPGTFNEKYLASLTESYNSLAEITETNEFNDTHANKALFITGNTHSINQSIIIILNKFQAGFKPFIFFFFQTDSSPPSLV